MSWFYNLKTAWKLYSGFGLCILLAVAVGAVATGRMGQMNATTDRIVNDPLDGMEDIALVDGAVRQIRVLEHGDSPME